MIMPEPVCSSIEPLILCYVWGVASRAQIADWLGLKENEIDPVLQYLRSKIDLFRILAEGPAIPHYSKLLDDWSLSQGK
jgi:hypothetical protein